MVELSETAHDALTELINIAIGRSAKSLNEMIGQEVSLSVPEIEFLTAGDATGKLGTNVSSDMTLVQQGFSGPISGSSFLAFMEDNSFELVKLLLGDQVPIEDIPELEQEAMKEVGNVILNAFLGSLGNELDITVASEIPEFKKNASAEQIFQSPSGNEHIILFVHVDFDLRDAKIDGYLVLIIGVSAMDALIGLVEDYVGKLA